MSEIIGNNYEQIRLKYGDEVANSLDQADGTPDKKISQKNLSIFNTALELLQEERQQQGYQKFENMPQVRANVSNRINIEHLAPWAREVATKALNYLEKVKENDRFLIKLQQTTDQEKTKSEIFDGLKLEREKQKSADIDFGL